MCCLLLNCSEFKTKHAKLQITREWTETCEVNAYPEWRLRCVTEWYVLEVFKNNLISDRCGPNRSLYIVWHTVLYLVGKPTTISGRVFLRTPGSHGVHALSWFLYAACQVQVNVQTLQIEIAHESRILFFVLLWNVWRNKQLLVYLFCLPLSVQYKCTI